MQRLYFKNVFFLVLTLTGTSNVFAQPEFDSTALNSTEQFSISCIVRRMESVLSSAQLWSMDGIQAEFEGFSADPPQIFSTAEYSHPVVQMVYFFPQEQNIALVLCSEANEMFSLVEMSFTSKTDNQFGSDYTLSFVQDGAHFVWYFQTGKIVFDQSKKNAHVRKNRMGDSKIMTGCSHSSTRQRENDVKPITEE